MLGICDKDSYNGYLRGQFNARQRRHFENGADFERSYQQWLNDHLSLVDDYIGYLSFIGLDVNNSAVAEVNKCTIDSVAGDYTTIISPFVNRKLLKVINGRPYVIDLKKLNISEPNDIDVFLTHNPFNHGAIRKWEDIPNNNYGNICVGMFGRLYDLDYQHNLEILHTLDDKIENSVFEYDTLDDGYFATVISNTDKKLVKVLKR